jgi:acetyl-CoA carboxylase carboxyltransferase component
VFVARERVELVLDEDSPFLELCALAGYDQDDMTLGKLISLTMPVWNQITNIIFA